MLQIINLKKIQKEFYIYFQYYYWNPFDKRLRIGSSNCLNFSNYTKVNLKHYKKLIKLLYPIKRERVLIKR